MPGSDVVGVFGDCLDPASRSVVNDQCAIAVGGVSKCRVIVCSMGQLTFAAEWRFRVKLG
jgi:hypothetical protein